MDTNQGYKNRALANLEGNWGTAAIVTLVFIIVAQGISQLVTTFAGETEGLLFTILWTLFCLPLGWGLLIQFLGLTRGETLGVGKLFDGYKDGRWGRIFTTYLLVEVYTLLWALLFIIPGIIKGLAYSQTGFILKDNPELANNAAIEKSMRMMEGHKMDLFMLYLSFIGWAILSLMTLGIGFLFLMPYCYTSLAHFYEDLKAESGE